MKYEDGEEKLPILLWLQPFLRGHRKKKETNGRKRNPGIFDQAAYGG